MASTGLGRWKLCRNPARAAWLWLGLAGLFAALAVATTWPLAKQITTGIPLGTEQVATVPLFNLWTLDWNVKSLADFYQGYWQAPIFHPTPNAFALSEPQPLTGLLTALVLGLTGSILLAYNLILLLALTLNGLLMAMLLRGVGLGWTAALTGGVLTLLLPFVHQELGVLQLVSLAGILALAASVWRFGTMPDLRRGLFLGLALTLAYGLSAQMAVFALLALAPAALWLWHPHWRTRRAWTGLAAGGMLFLVLTSPVLLAQSQATNATFERSMETVRKQSAQAAHYLKSPWPQLFPLPGVETAERPSQRAFWLGTLRVLLALSALGALLTFPESRRFAITAFLVLGTSFLLSLGAHLEFGGTSPASWLRSLPGLSQIRSFFRFAAFAQLATVALAALGLEWITRTLRHRFPRAALPLVAAMALLAMVELRPARAEIQPLPPLDLDLPWVNWIVESTEPESVLAFVPFPEGRSVRDYLGTSQWMYWQMRHGRTMVNGYSGFFPANFRQLKKTMASFPSQQALHALQEADVDYCIIHRSFMETSEPPEAGPLQLVPVFQDEQHGLAIFALEGQ